MMAGKPAGVRDVDRKPWVAGHLVNNNGVAIIDVTGEIGMADDAIARMLSGKLPAGAGRFTAEVSRVFTAATLLGMDLSKSIAMLCSDKMKFPVRIQPFASGLAEVRKAAGRKI